MGRIADSVLDLLADGPLDAERLGQALAEAGVTRSRDPGSAVRQAIRDDPRVIQTVRAKGYMLAHPDAGR